MITSISADRLFLLFGFSAENPSQLLLAGVALQDGLLLPSLLTCLLVPADLCKSKAERGSG